MHTRVSEALGEKFQKGTTAAVIITFDKKSAHSILAHKYLHLVMRLKGLKVFLLGGGGE